MAWPLDPPAEVADDVLKLLVGAALCVAKFARGGAVLLLELDQEFHALGDEFADSGNFAIMLRRHFP